MSTLAQYRVLAKSDAGRALLTKQRNGLAETLVRQQQKLEAARAPVLALIAEIDQALSEIEA